MPNWLKGLVAVTCVAVLAVIGYYFWGQYQAAQDAQRLALIQEERAACLTELDRFVRGNDERKAYLDNCGLLQRITQADWERARSAANRL